MYFDRFDIVEAYYIWAHDNGDYALFDHIEQVLKFKARPSLCFDTLTENSLEIYNNIKREVY